MVASRSGLVRVCKGIQHRMLEPAAVLILSRLALGLRRSLATAYSNQVLGSKRTLTMLAGRAASLYGLRLGYAPP